MQRIDMHVHVGLLGDDPAFAAWGRISPWMRTQPVYRIMLRYARIDPAAVSDAALRRATVAAITESTLDQVVLLALDPVFDRDGIRRPERSNLWVDNSYILDLRREIGPRVLFGASVHPYDPAFTDRVLQAVQDGAVLLKWLPSAQQIDLADPRVRQALVFLATAGRGGAPLPLLLHVGAEYAIMTTDPHTSSHDFLSWGLGDRLGNLFRSRSRRWATPDLTGVHANLRAGLEAGGAVILAHCGLPYFAPRWLGLLEHNDLPMVRRYLDDFPGRDGIRGKCFADVSACVTPFRQSYFPDIAALRADALLVGSDFPVPVFELSADLAESVRDLEAMIREGRLDRLIVPQDNLLQVNWRELEHAFPRHPMFANTARLFGPA